MKLGVSQIRSNATGDSSKLWHHLLLALGCISSAFITLGQAIKLTQEWARRLQRMHSRQLLFLSAEVTRYRQVHLQCSKS